MKLFNIILIVILIVLIFTITRDNSTTPSIVQPTQQFNNSKILTDEDILIENRGPPSKVFDEFPVPQTTAMSKSLSPNNLKDLSIITNGAILPQKDTINIDINFFYRSLRSY